MNDDNLNINNNNNDNNDNYINKNWFDNIVLSNENIKNNILNIKKEIEKENLKIGDYEYSQKIKEIIKIIQEKVFINDNKNNENLLSKENKRKIKDYITSNILNKKTTYKEIIEKEIGKKSNNEILLLTKLNKILIKDNIVKENNNLSNSHFNNPKLKNMVILKNILKNSKEKDLKKYKNINKIKKIHLLNINKSVSEIINEINKNGMNYNYNDISDILRNNQIEYNETKTIKTFKTEDEFLSSNEKNSYNFITKEKQKENNFFNNIIFKIEEILNKDFKNENLKTNEQIENRQLKAIEDVLTLTNSKYNSTLKNFLEYYNNFILTGMIENSYLKNKNNISLKDYTFNTKTNIIDFYKNLNIKHLPYNKIEENKIEEIKENKSLDLSEKMSKMKKDFIDKMSGNSLYTDSLKAKMSKIWFKKSIDDETVSNIELFSRYGKSLLKNSFISPLTQFSNDVKNLINGNNNSTIDEMKLFLKGLSIKEQKEIQLQINKEKYKKRKLIIKNYIKDLTKKLNNNKLNKNDEDRIISMTNNLSIYDGDNEIKTEMENLKNNYLENLTLRAVVNFNFSDQKKCLNYIINDFLQLNEENIEEYITLNDSLKNNKDNNNFHSINRYSLKKIDELETILKKNGFSLIEIINLYKHSKLINNNKNNFNKKKFLNTKINSQSEKRKNDIKNNLESFYALNEEDKLKKEKNSKEKLYNSAINKDKKIFTEDLKNTFLSSNSLRNILFNQMTIEEKEDFIKKYNVKESDLDKTLINYIKEKKIEKEFINNNSYQLDYSDILFLSFDNELNIIDKNKQFEYLTIEINSLELLGDEYKDKIKYFKSIQNEIIENKELKEDEKEYIDLYKNQFHKDELNIIKNLTKKNINELSNIKDLEIYYFYFKRFKPELFKNYLLLNENQNKNIDIKKRIKDFEQYKNIIPKNQYNYSLNNFTQKFLIKEEIYIDLNENQLINKNFEDLKFNLSRPEKNKNSENYISEWKKNMFFEIGINNNSLIFFNNYIDFYNLRFSKNKLISLNTNSHFKLEKNNNDFFKDLMLILTQIKKDGNKLNERQKIKLNNILFNFFNSSKDFDKIVDYNNEYWNTDFFNSFFNNDFFKLKNKKDKLEIIKLLKNNSYISNSKIEKLISIENNLNNDLLNIKKNKELKKKKNIMNIFK